MSSIRRSWIYICRNKYLYLMLLPGFAMFVLFRYVPMYGILIAFKDFSFREGILGSPWIGLENFRYMFELRAFRDVFVNSVVLSALRLIVCFPAPIILALMINEIPGILFKRSLQTIIYLPYFISWVIIGGILVTLLSPSWGVVNVLIKELGFEPIFFLGDDRYFRGVAVFSSLWKQAGWDTIIYLAAITAVNPELYESSTIDGANRLQQIIHITLPSIRPTIVILLILNIGNLMNNGFEQIYMLQNSINLRVSQVFETYTFQLGIQNGRFAFATTVGLFSSVVGFILLSMGNWFAKAIGEEGLF